MGQWLSCTIFFTSSPRSAAPASSHSTLPSKHASLKTPTAATAINRRAVGTESTLVDSATSQSVTAFPLSTTVSFASSHLSISPPRHHRYLSATSSVPFSASTSASPPAPVSSPPPQPTHVRSSSASSCSSTCGLTSVIQDGLVMTRTSSHVDDIIEEVVEPTPSPPSYTPPPLPHVRSMQPSIEQQQMEEAEEAGGEARCATLGPLSTPHVLSPRSVLAFMIVSNGGECETADESSWSEEVEELEEEEEDDMGGLSMRDILASLPQTSTTYLSPFPSTSPPYSVPSLLPSASSLRTSSRYTATSLSYPSLTVLARHSLRQQRHQHQSVQQANVLDSSEEEEEEGGCGEWSDDSRVAVSTRSMAQWTRTSVASGL